jgi:hypothetical protein
MQIHDTLATRHAQGDPPLYEAEDFGEALAPELRAQEERLRTQVERQKES